MVWGTDDWATDDDMEFTVDKALSNSFSATDTVTKESGKPIANTFSAANTIPTITLQDSNGFLYVFPSDTTNGADITSGVYSPVSEGSDGFTTLPINTTSWVTS